MTRTQGTIRLGVSGATGRTGRLVMAIALEDRRVAPIALRRSTAESRRRIGTSHLDVIVDVSTEEGCRSAIELAGESGVPLVIGTTGLGSETLGNARALATRVPVLIAPNLSRGALLMRRLAAIAARLAPADWTFDLVETHRAGKRDAPSGTALAIDAESVDSNGASRLEGRIASIRTGDVVGEHRLRIVADGEELLLEHRALDRTVFARGAIEAAVWIVDRPAGLHRFDSWLDSRLDSPGSADQDSGDAEA